MPLLPLSVQRAAQPLNAFRFLHLTTAALPAAQTDTCMPAPPWTAPASAGVPAPSMPSMPSMHSASAAFPPSTDGATAPYHALPAHMAALIFAQQQQAQMAALQGGGGGGLPIWRFAPAPHHGVAGAGPFGVRSMAPPATMYGGMPLHEHHAMDSFRGAPYGAVAGMLPRVAGGGGLSQGFQAGLLPFQGVSAVQAPSATQ
jgi:hypothetical protein